MNRADINLSEMTIKEIRKELNPTEYVVACNPVISENLKEIILDTCASFGSPSTQCYYTKQLTEHLVREPFGKTGIDEVGINEVFMLEKAYDIVMFYDS